MSDIQAYCVKCKTSRAMIDAQPTFTSNGAPGTRGKCAVCGTTLFRMGATPAHEGIPRPAVKTVAKKTSKKPATKTAKGVKRASTKAASQRRANSKTKTALAKNASSKKIDKLVIVESPAKARSVSHFLGKNYTVKASKGHVRDLLVSQLSVDVENNFEPKYRVLNDKRDVVKELKVAVSNASEVYLATDPDREGEAIAWHLIAATDMKDVPVKRVVFHEITEQAVQEAFDHPRDLNLSLVNAQQARRILDRLVGYNITELLWDKVRNRLSAGRVQSIAVRLIVDREREIEAFVPKEYWTLDAKLRKQTQNGRNQQPFVARLIQIGADEVEFGSEGDVNPHLDVLRQSQYVVVEVKHGERIRKPSAPFTTSTLQQEASRRLGFNARRTMSVAQQLYEGIELKGEGSVGLITYMRTDSLTVSPQAQAEAREFIGQRYGSEFLPAKAPTYKTKAKGAQEAHEAIRPTRVLREPDQIKAALTSDQYRLYTLIWQRFLASQMAHAVYNTLRVDIEARPANTAPSYLFRVSGSTIKFMGFLVLYEDARDEDLLPDEDEGRLLPELKVGEQLDLLELLPEQHFTQPPPRYTEASLVRTLEEYGIGRPSTYAPTVAVIQDREYVIKRDKRLLPTETGRIVNDLLVKYFPEIMDYRFTARMENRLDEIAAGRREWQPMLADFYGPFSRELQKAYQQAPSLQQEEAVGRNCPVCGKPLVIRYGRFGKFVGCSDYPNCRHTEPWLDRIGIACPACGAEHHGELVLKRSRRGRIFYGCSRYPHCDFTSWKRPLPQPCPKCGGLLVEQNRSAAQCTACGARIAIAELLSTEAEPA